jgi:ABC-type transport system involved in multi-copper enzyme maturation permease subunit
LLLLVITTGILLVFRNLPGYRFSPLFVAVLDFSHLGLVVVFLTAALIAAIFRRPWLAS